MDINLDDLTVRFRKDISSRLIEDWSWLVGTDKKVIMISVIGDMFLEGDEGKIFWLDVGGGELKMVASDIRDFEGKLTDFDLVNEWFLIDLTLQLRGSNTRLNDEQVYSYRTLPIMGGDYSVDNFAPLGIEAHFHLTGHIHKKIKDLPDGTMVEIKVTD